MGDPLLLLDQIEAICQVGSDRTEISLIFEKSHDDIPVGL
jgi:hypothetical protein